MMKKLFLNLLLLLVIAIGAAAQTEVVIGEGTSTTYVTPFNSLWGYSFVEQIYTADEIGMPGTITSISFNLSESNASQTNSVDVFMKSVTRENFADATDYETVTASDMVFSGTVTFNPGWSTITLDTPFEYDGSSNLMIAIHEYTSGYSTRYFYYTATTDSKVVTFHSDSSDPNPYSIGSYSGNSYTSPNRANITMEIIPDASTCLRPTAVTISNLAPRSATVSWTRGATETSWQICFQNDEDDLITVTDTTYSFVDLTPESDYTVKVRAVCGEDNFSSWSANRSFTTLIACPKPTGLTISNITAHSATATWTRGASETAWEVCLDDDSDQIYQVSDTVYQITGLGPESDYTIKVRAVCGGIDGESAWTNNVSYTTTVSCPAPSNFALAAYTPTTATLSWFAGEAEGWTLQYGTDENYDEGTFTEIANITEATYEITGLTPETLYYARVMASCAAGEESDWSEISFEPSAKVIIGSGTATFGYLPTYSFYNYSLTQQIYTAAEIGTAGYIHSIDFFNAGSQKTRTLDVYLVATNKTTFANASDFIPVTAEDLVYSGTFIFAEGVWKTIEFDTDFYYDGTSNVALIVDDNTGSYSSGLNCRVFDATSQAIYVYSDGTSYDPFNPDYSGSISNTKNQIRLLINPGEPPSCFRPTNLTVSDITVSSAIVSWTAGGTETSWGLKYGPEGFDPETEGTYVEISTTPTYTIEDLTGNTAYDVYVKSICGVDDETSWRNISFRTACVAISSFPWTENFESYESGNFTAPCWENEHISGSGSSIFRIYTSANGTNSTHQLQLPDMYSGTMTKLMLPEMNFGGVAHQFLIDVYRTSSTSNYAEGIRIFASSDGNIEGATELGFISRSYLTSDAEHGIPAEAASGWYTYELNIPITGTCYIIIRGESLYGSSTYMDNFVVREAPSCLKPTMLTASDITAHTANITWNAGAAETAWQVCLDDDEDNLIDVTATAYAMVDLAAESDYTVRVRANCGGGDFSEWTSNVTLHTAIACPVPTNLSASVANITAHEAVLTWTAGASETAWQVCINDDMDDLRDATEATYTLTGLAADSDYVIKVRAVCGGIDGESQWSTPKTIHTLPTCPSPTALEGTPTSATTATLTWTAGGSEGSWIVQYCDNNTFTDGTYTEVPADETTVDISGLTPETTYYARVKAVCSDDDMSVWSATCNFEPTAKIVIGTAEGTDNYLPTYSYYNYTLSQQIYTADEIGTPGEIMSIDFYNAGSEKTRNFDVYLVNTEKTSFSGSSDWITVTAEDRVFSGSVTFTPNVWTTIEFPEGFQYDGTSNLAVIVDDNTGSYSSGLSCNVFAATSQAIRVYSDGTDYDPTNPGGYSGTVMDVKNHVRLLVGNASCARPNALEASNVGPTSADITWNANGEETAWQICFNGDEDNLIDVTATNYSFADLTPETTYTVMVRANCGEGEVSLWSSVVTFTTTETCPTPYDITVTPSATAANVNWTGFSDSYVVRYRVSPEQVLFSDDFDNGLNEGWTNIDADGDGYVWVGSSEAPGIYHNSGADVSGTGHNSSYGYAISGSYTNAASSALTPDNWFVTPQISLPQDAEGINFRFYANTQDINYPTEHYGVYISTTSATDTAAFTMLWTEDMDPDGGPHREQGAWGEKNTDITAYAGQNVYLAIRHFNCTDMFLLNVDDVSVIVTEATEWTTVTSSSSPVVLSGLTPETTYQYQVNGICDGNDNWSAISTFTTLPEDPDNHTIIASAGANGTITPNGMVTVADGDDQAFTITANADYRIASVMVDGVEAINSLVNGVYTFTNVTADHTIIATFESAVVTYTITASAGANGTITPSGNVTVEEGGSQAFTITADAEYRIASVLVDGVEAINNLVDGVYTFTNVTSNHTIAATFASAAVVTYTITATAGEHGTITPSGEVIVNEGANQIFTIAPEEGYHIATLTVDGNNAMDDIIDYAYTFVNVRANHTIEVTFSSNAIDEYAAASMAIYPNPNNGMFSIDFSNIEGDATYQLIDARGAIIETRDINVANGETMTFNHNLVPGTYFVRIINADKVYVGQIVVE